LASTIVLVRNNIGYFGIDLYLSHFRIRRWNLVVGDAFLATGVKKTAFDHWYDRHQLAELIAAHGTNHLAV